MLVASILVIGIQETSKSYINVARDFKSETDLQNIADSALFEAIEIIKSPDFEFKKPDDSIRRNNQHPIPLGRNYNANVTVFYEYGTDYFDKTPNIKFMRKKYPSENIVDTSKPNAKGVILISVASRKIDDDTTIYKKSLAYILEDNEGKLNYKTIYFMNSLPIKEQ